jgi:hypothetical protein
MPSILCECGNKISYGEIPCPYEWLMISDVSYGSFWDGIDAEALYKK